MATAELEKTKTPGVYKKGNRYIVVWRHRGKQNKSSHRTYAEAREAKGRRQAGDSQATSRVMFDVYARSWLDGYAGRTSRGFTEQARADYRRSLESYLVPAFAGCRLGDIERADVRDVIKTLEQHGLAPASVVKNITPLRALLATALDDGLIRTNPAAGVRVNQRRGETDEEPEAKAMTQVELQRLLAEIPDRWELLFQVLAKTGLRISEVLGLDWDDVEFGARPRLKVRRQWYRGDLRKLKTHAGRRDLPLSPALARLLWSARPTSHAGAIFVTRDGNRLNDRNVRRVLDAAAERAEVDWVHFHTFRHTAASMLFDAGKNIRQVSDFLGHADPAFTLRTYVHLMDDGIGDVASLDAIEGNKRATAHPQTAANDQVGPASEMLPMQAKA